MADLTTASPEPPHYPVRLEVAGALALFAWPDTGGTPTDDVVRAPAM